MDPVFQKTLTRAGQVRSFQILPQTPAGWESSEQSNDQVFQRHHYSDWHRVERELARFTRQIADLRRDGWSDA